ncbi:MAG: tRNA lysidine(34) synthetase TilS [Bacteroidota bacterium]
MATFAERLLASARDACGLTRTDRLGVAASGGVDSTVLLRTLAEAGWPLVALHVHHGLRPEADADAGFVRRLGDEIGVEAEVLHVEVAKGNLQAEARRARYAALAEAAARHGCTAVVTGHTATDQAETVLMNLVRGAGLRGLGGMAPRRPIAPGSPVALVRPMLWASRAEVEAEAARHGWTWRDDASNATDASRRNRIRHRVLTLLEEEGGPDTAVRIAQAAAAARAALAGPAPLAVLEAYGRDRAVGGAVALPGVRGLPATVRLGVWAEAVRRWAPGAMVSMATLAQVDALLGAKVGRRVEAGGVAVWREGDALAVGPSASDQVSPFWHVLLFDSSVWALRTEAGVLHSAPPASGEDHSDNTVLVDADRLPEAGTLRLWADGDRIRPVGMKGSKRVSDLLRERDVPASVRRRVPVVEADGDVLWVVGHRVSRRIAADAATTTALAWTWTPTGGE